MKLYHVIVAIFVLLFSCNNVSEESEKAIETLSAIRAEITITKKASEEKLTAEAHLYDKEDKEYANPNLNILVNNQKLNFWMNHRGYYSKNIQYASSEISPAEGYRVELQLANDSLALLGYVRAIPKINLSEDLQIPETFNNDKDYSFSWKNIKPLTQLEVVLSQSDIATNQNHKGTVITRFEKINPQKGSFNIKASQFRDSIFLGTRMEIKFNGSTNGLVDPNLMAGSFCKSELVFQKTILVNSNNLEDE